MFLVVFLPHNLLKEASVEQNALDYAKYGMYIPLDVLLFFQSGESEVVLEPLQSIAEESMSEIEAESMSEMKAESETLQKSSIKRRVATH
jgi:hypothetical protein